MSESVDLSALAKAIPKTLQYKPTPLTAEELKGVAGKKHEARNNEARNNEARNNEAECPICGGKLQIRKRRTDGKPFIGCENFFYIGCRYTRGWD